MLRPSVNLSGPFGVTDLTQTPHLPLYYRMHSWSAATWGRVTLAILVLASLLSITATLEKSVTVDEFQAMPSGLAILETGDFRYPLGTPPLSQILPALPAFLGGAYVKPVVGPTANWAVAHEFAEGGTAEFHRFFLWARFVSLAVFFGTMVGACALSEALYGPAAAALTAACMALNPTLLAHGSLVTPDIYLACAFMLFLLSLDRYARQASTLNAVFIGTSIGAACLSKFTGLALFPLLPILFWAIRSQRLLHGTIVALLAALAVIHIGYAFQEPFALAGSVPVVWLPSWLPLPFPAQFIRAIQAQLGESSYAAYLLGSFNHHGYFTYYLVALLVKTPPGLTLLAALASLGKLKPRERPVVILGIFLFILFSLARYKNLGVRYLLFLYPLVAVFIARLNAHRWRWLISAAIASLVTSAAISWPDYLAYFNLPSGGASFGHHYLLDSNLDWGQDLTTLKTFLEKRSIPEISLAHFGHVDPALYGIKATLLNGRPASRYVAISANFLWGRSYYVNGTQFYPASTAGYEAYQSVTPLAVLGNSIYVFDSEKIPQLAQRDIGSDPKRRPEKNTANKKEQHGRFEHPETSGVYEPPTNGEAESRY